MLVLVLVLVLDAKRLKSFEDEYENEDETANELIESALTLRSFFPIRLAVFLARGSARVKLHWNDE